MAQTATLHVKLDPAEDRRLKVLAESRRTSKGQLVREAIAACYQAALDGLPIQQRQAIAAYEGGFISLGRLAQAMGKHPLELRTWLREHDITQNSVYGDRDASHA